MSQYASVPLDVYGRVLTEGQENLIKVRNEVGEVEMVLEKRMSESRTQKREGYFVVEVRGGYWRWRGGYLRWRGGYLRWRGEEGT